MLRNKPVGLSFKERLKAQMGKTKRNAVRAIIFVDDKIMSMYREKNDRIYYTFPGGGQEQNESQENCAIREIKEEFGINVKPIKKVYTYKSKNSIEHFYICEWINGEFGTGQGEEFQKGQLGGLYKPTMINISDIPNLPLMPPELASIFYMDYIKNGKELRSRVKMVVSKA